MYDCSHSTEHDWSHSTEVSHLASEDRRDVAREAWNETASNNSLYKESTYTHGH